MTEILTQIGVQNVTAALSIMMVFIGVCAFLTSIVTEALKSIRVIDQTGLLYRGVGSYHSDILRNDGIYEAAFRMVHDICIISCLVCGSKSQHEWLG